MNNTIKNYRILLLIVIVSVILIISFRGTPAYAGDSIYPGDYKASEIESYLSGSNLFLEGDTTIYVDMDVTCMSIIGGGYELTIKGDGIHTMAFEGHSKLLSAGFLSLENVDLKMSSNDEVEWDGPVMSADDIVIKNSNINISSNTNLPAIYATYGITAKDSNIIVMSTNSGTKARAIEAVNYLDVSNSVINTDCPGGIASTGGSLSLYKVNGTIKSLSDTAILGGQSVVIAECELMIDCKRHGIYSDNGSIGVVNSEINIKSGNDMIRGNAGIDIQGSDISGTSANTCCFVSTDGKITIIDSKLDVLSATAASALVALDEVYLNKVTGSIKGLYGINSDKSIKIRDSELQIEGLEAALICLTDKIEFSSNLYIKNLPEIKTAEYEDENFVKYQVIAKENGDPAKAIEIAFKRLSDEWCTVSTPEDQVYTSVPMSPGVTVKWRDTELIAGKDYTLSYSDNTEVGTATITVTGEGDYTGTTKTTFKILPAPDDEIISEPVPEEKMGSDGTPYGKGASYKAVNKAITSAVIDNKDPKGTVFSALKLRQSKVTSNSIKVAWDKVKNAKKYVVYANVCGKTKLKKVKSTTGSSYTLKKISGKNLKKGKYYKFMVVALDKNNNVITTSKIAHIATNGGKFTNAKSITTKAKNNKVTIKKGKTFKLGTKVKLVSSKLKTKNHRATVYETSNKKIATVSSKGVIKAIKKGTCYVYVYAQNGAYKKIKVTVKNA